MKKVANRLRKARALIEKGWTQEAWARAADGANVPFSSRSAVCFCAAGALNRALQVGGHEWGLAEQSWQVLEDAIGVSSSSDVVKFNDAPERTQAEVLAAFDKAIELAEQSA